MCLSEKLAIKGVWFLPSYQNHRIAGELCYDPETGSELTLYGLFSDHLMTVSDSQPVIIGLVEGSRYITLFDTILTKRGSITFRKQMEPSAPSAPIARDLSLATP